MSELGFLSFIGVTGLCKEWLVVGIYWENRVVFKVFLMDPVIDLAGMLLVVVFHAGILALRLGTALHRA
ncbi:photosystem I reaction center subunit XII [Prochlorococcus sp. MIT 1300]|uniref:photosystem I reaction center subunit XII n=1 Tax=Prochlorococcus sp. MIT 1300 TaxID=3096218 RepID=UPI002A74E075|nr:photosystem I reaction center subunit XII [Prochlorococcus sp. MIT 1300]